MSEPADIALKAEPSVQSVPLREDQITNAISFLTHPKVSASPIATKRSFLERKGLTTEEIEEAFRRVPAEPTAAIATASPAPNHQGLVTYVPQVAPQPVAPQLQQQLAAPAPPAQQLTAVVPMQQARPEPVRWTQVSTVKGKGRTIAGSFVARHSEGHTLRACASRPPLPMQVVLGLGVVAAGIYAVHTIAMPYLTSLYSGWSASPKARQEEQERQRQEALQVADTLRKVQEALQAAGENMAEAARSLKEQAAR